MLHLFAMVITDVSLQLCNGMLCFMQLLLRLIIRGIAMVYNGYEIKTLPERLSH